MLAAVQRGMTLPDSECPPVVESVARDERTELICSVLATALRIRANELRIAPSVIAKRDELEALLARHDAGCSEPAPEIMRPEGWKRAAAGDWLLSILNGNYGLTISPEAPDGVALTPMPWHR